MAAKTECVFYDMYMCDDDIKRKRVPKFGFEPVTLWIESPRATN